MTHNVKLVVALSTGRSSSVLVLYWQFRNLAKTALLILHLHAFFHPTFSSSWSQAPVALCLLSGPFHRCCEAPKPRERTYKSPHTRSCQALLTKTCTVLSCSWEPVNDTIRHWNNHHCNINTKGRECVSRQSATKWINLWENVLYRIDKIKETLFCQLYHFSEGLKTEGIQTSSATR